VTRDDDIIIIIIIIVVTIIIIIIIVIVVFVFVVIIINRWGYSPMQTFTSLQDLSHSALFFDLSFQFAILYFYKLNYTNISGEVQPVCKLFPLTGMSSHTESVPENTNHDKQFYHQILISFVTYQKFLALATAVP
jgi:hypothetical protein